MFYLVLVLLAFVVFLAFVYREQSWAQALLAGLAIICRKSADLLGVCEEHITAARSPDSLIPETRPLPFKGPVS